MSHSLATISTYNRQDQGVMTQRAQRKNVVITSLVEHVVGALTLLPFEVVSTELQLAASLEGPIPSSWVVTASLWKQHGARFLFISGIPHILKHCLNAGMVTYFLFQSLDEMRGK